MGIKRNKIGKVLKQVQGLRIRIRVNEKGEQFGIGIYHGKHLLEGYASNQLHKAIRDAEGLCAGRYFKRDLRNKLKSRTH